MGNDEISLLPKWMMKRYLVLRKEIQSKPTNFVAVHKVLDKYFGDSDKVTRIFLSELRKAGWVEVNFDPQDNRMRLYQLKEAEEIFETVVAQVYAKR